MDIKTSRSMHPLTAIAAVSVTLFSLAGIAAITGLIPTSHSQPALVQPAAEPLKSAAATPPAETNNNTAAETVAKPAAHKPAIKHSRTSVARPAEEPVKAVKVEAPVTVSQNVPPAGYGPPPGYAPPPAYAPAPAVEPPKPICHECGVIESVREVEKAGQGSGVGAVAGGLAGGVLGHQTGGGRAKNVMAVLGAVGGAFAGNAIEKNVKKSRSYEIAIRFDDGTSRIVTQDSLPAWRSGDRIKVVNGAITASNS